VSVPIGNSAASDAQQPFIASREGEVGDRCINRQITGRLSVVHDENCADLVRFRPQIGEVETFSIEIRDIAHRNHAGVGIHLLQNPIWVFAFGKPDLRSSGCSQSEGNDNRGYSLPSKQMLSPSCQVMLSQSIETPSATLLTNPTSSGATRHNLPIRSLTRSTTRFCAIRPGMPSALSFRYEANDAVCLSRGGVSPPAQTWTTFLGNSKAARLKSGEAAGSVKTFSVLRS